MSCIDSTQPLGSGGTDGAPAALFLGAAVCPFCSHLFTPANTRYPLHADATSNDDITRTVGARHVVFATAIAQFFGAVHWTQLDTSSNVRVCRPGEAAASRPGDTRHFSTGGVR